MTKLTDNHMITVEKPFTKTDLLSHLSNVVGIPQKQIDDTLKALSEVIFAHLKKGIPFSFMGLLKFYTSEKAATPEREAPNPFTGKMTTFPAKPAHKAVRIKPLKKLKETVN